MRMTETRKAVFLEELRRHGVVSRAALSASPGARGGYVQSFRDELRRDPGFELEWARAAILARVAA